MITKKFTIIISIGLLLWLDVELFLNYIRIKIDYADHKLELKEFCLNSARSKGNPHSYEVSAIIFVNESIIASGDKSCEVLIWNIYEKKVLKRLKYPKHFESNVKSSIYFQSVRNKYLLTACGGLIEIWNIIDWSSKFRIYSESPIISVIDPNKLAVLSKAHLVVWDIEKFTKINHLNNHDALKCLSETNNPFGMILRSNKNYLVSANNKNICVFNVISMELVFITRMTNTIKLLEVIEKNFIITFTTDKYLTMKRLNLNSNGFLVEKEDKLRPSDINLNAIRYYGFIDQILIAGKDLTIVNMINKSEIYLRYYTDDTATSIDMSSDETVAVGFNSGSIEIHNLSDDHHFNLFH